MIALQLDKALGAVPTELRIAAQIQRQACDGGRQGQAAATEALRSGRDNDYAAVAKMREVYDRRRRMMHTAFNNMGLDCFEPLGAFYVFPCIKSMGMTSDEFCEKLLMEQKVATVPGTAFGDSGEGYIRCSYATSTEKIAEALRRIETFVNQHRGH